MDEKKPNREQNKPKITIATHNGGFHADDIFAVASLSLLLEKEYGVKVIRTRDMEVIRKADYVVDVGFVYDPEHNRFDHHQTGGAGARDNGIKYSSIGLVWKQYGEKICGDTDVAQYIDERLIAAIDAIDNGQEVYTPLYEHVKGYFLADFFDMYKPSWNEDQNVMDEKFFEVVKIARSVLVREIERRRSRIVANDLVEKIYVESDDKRIIILDEFCPWGEVLKKYPEPLMVVYPARMAGKWNVEVIQDEEYANTRISFPEAWAGKQGEELEKISGVVGALFCHNGRYLCAAHTKEAVLALGEKALEEAGK